jgi:hypothetical protein
MAAIHNVLAGSAGRLRPTITISSNQTNYVLNTAKVANYKPGTTDVTLIIESGIYVSSNATSGPALDVDTSWAAGDTITIVNNGFIVGRGGAGGGGGTGNPGNFSTSGFPGSAGGLALRVSRAVSINNTGTIAGGGGGGRGGNAVGVFSSDAEQGTFFVGAGGGGGGGGRSNPSSNAAGGFGGSNVNISTTRVPQSGASGTTSSQGSGGLGGQGSGYTGQTGFSGGDWGSSGGGTGGGAAGAAVSGNSNITWIATGTRLGPIT